MSVTFFFQAANFFSRDRGVANTRDSFELDDSRAVRAQEIKNRSSGRSWESV